MNKKNITSIIDKIEARAINLYKINGINLAEVELENVDDKFEIENYTKVDTEIFEHKDDILKIKVNIRTGFKPEIIFVLDMQYIIECKLNSPLEEKEIKENINELIRPVGDDFSFLTSFISDRMINRPIIIPPKIEVNGK